MNRRLTLPCLCALLVLLSSVGRGWGAMPAFPLKVSGSQRYLTDQAGTPFLVVGDTAWSLIAQLNEEDVARYLDDRARRGFNSIIVSLVEHKFASKAPAKIDGTPPFLKAGDFSQPNPVYFDYAFRVVEAARQRGISVWLCPAYLGWGGKDEGFFQELQAAGPAVLKAYGRFVGARFKDLPNLVWMMGGDYAMPQAERWTGQELALGLREGGAKQIMTAHGGQTSAVETFGDQAWLEVDNVYRYQEDLWRPLQAAWIQQPTRPFVMIESAYEGEHKSTPDRIRRQAWWPMLCGACGQFFGNNPIWYFDGPGFTNFKSSPTWQQALDSTGARDMTRLGEFIRQRPWWLWVPDLRGEFITAGAGSGAAKAVAAHTRDWRTAVLYIPSDGQGPRSLTLDCRLFPGSVTAQWFNPAKDSPLLSHPSPLANAAQQTLTTFGDNGTGANDWVLVLEATGEVPSLVTLARNIRPDFLLGSFASGLESSEERNSAAGDFFRTNFNIMTVGVYMQGTQPQRLGYNFKTTDALIDFAEKNRQKVYLHPLIGGAEYTSQWVYEDGLSSEALLHLLHDRITTILSRYKGRIHYVDVVNEALTGQGTKADGSFDWQEKAYRGPEHVWLKTLGMYQGKKHQFPNYLVEAFRTARQAGGPDLKLILNEWGNETTKSMRGHAFLALIQALREEGVPVDGAGLQLHCRLKKGKFCGWASDLPFDFEAFAAMLQLYEQAGIEVHITEFDIHLEANPTERDYELQGQCYARILECALSSPAVKSFKTWGFTDRHSWKENGQDGHPLLLNENLQPKPAYLRQIQMLEKLTLTKPTS